MQTTFLEVRDQREKDWYWSNNEFIDHYGEIVGEHAVAVYSVLCRHANNDTQKCFPSMDTIGRKAGIKSRKTVSKAIEILEQFNIIDVEKGQAADGKRLNNIYHLKNPRAWKKVARSPEAVEEDDGLEEFERDPVPAAPVKKEKEVIAIVLPDWLNAGAWAEWVKFRKEIKKTLTPISIKQQLKFLEAHKADHVEIIRHSIMNGYQGLFPLKKGQFNKAPSRGVAPAEGKYAGIK